MLPTLQVGPLAINTPGLILLLGLWLGLYLTEKSASSHGMKADFLYTLAAILLIAGALGARLVYVLVNFPDFRSNLVSILSLDYHLLDPWGGMAAGLVAGGWYIQKEKQPTWSVLDAYVPTLAVLGVSLSLANLASGSGYGLPTNLPWALEFLGARRHPVPIYEGLAALLILLGMLALDRKFKGRLPTGTLFWAFLAFSAITRLTLEAFRADSQILFEQVRTVQVGAWLVLAVSLWFLGKQFRILAASQRSE